MGLFNCKTLELACVLHILENFPKQQLISNKLLNLCWLVDMSLLTNVQFI